jgi:RNA polymerase sigma factor for flagellar operon FliA
MLTVAPPRSSIAPLASFIPVAPARRTLSRETYEHFLPMVRRIAMGFARKVPSTIGLDDMMSAGWIGVAEAFARTNDAMPIEEVDAFVSRRVKGAILDYLRSASPKARMARSNSRRMARVVTRLTSSLGRAPTDGEVAGDLDLSLDEYLAASSVANTRLELVDIDDLEISDSTLPADELAHRSALVARVASAIPSLPERIQKVLMLYYQESCTLKEIGAVLGLTESRVSQLHSEAMKTLRASMSDA